MTVHKILFLFLFTMIINLSRAATCSIEITLKIASGIQTKTKEIFLAGDFNGWHTSDKQFQFKENKAGEYQLKLTLENGSYEYKIVRGDWQTVEVDKQGREMKNRILKVDRDSTVQILVANWADNFQIIQKKSTAASNVHIIDTAFQMPQLQRQRRVWIYLPMDYINSTRSYPVIYMQDGQNVFDEATAYSGEWGVDEYLNSLPVEKQSIIVAIDNGGALRMNEYNPYNNKRFGKAEGGLYVDFIVNTLKPYIDQHYRTQPQKINTAIAGSSMGGLISFYAMLKYPEVFGIGGIFSPSFWIAPKINAELKKRQNNLKDQGYYFYGGGLETDSMKEHIQIINNQLHTKSRKQSQIQTKIDINPDGIHNEHYWRIAFPAFYQWFLTFQKSN